MNGAKMSGWGRAIHRAVWRSSESAWGFSIAATVLFATLLALGQAHHEFWRDETHPWTLAREAQGFWDIATGDRMYDGHPPLWYWYLRVWSWVTRDIVGLHIATAVAEATAGLILFRWGPFPRLLKALLLCSYLLGYEYGIMARNYTMGVLMAFAFAATYHPLKTRAISFVFLALLALSSIFGLIMAAVFAMLLVLRRARLQRSQEDGASIWALRAPASIYLGAVFLLVMFVFTYAVTNPPDPNPYSPGWVPGQLNSSAIVPSLQRIVAAFLPLRKPHDPAYWIGASQYVAEYPNLFRVIDYLLPAMMVLALVPAWPELLTLVLGTFLMSVVLVARYAGHIRHWGSFFVLFLVVSWIARKERPRRWHVVNTALLVVIGACQLQGFCVSFKFDWFRSFSGGGETAAAIKKLRLQDLPLVMGPDWDAMAVTGYLDRKFISSETEEVNQTMVFHGRRRGFSPEGLTQKGLEVARERKTPVLVVSNRPLPKPAGASAFDLLYQTDKPLLMGDEAFWVYKLSP